MFNSSHDPSSHASTQRFPEEFADHQLLHAPHTQDHRLIPVTVHSADYLTDNLLRIVVHAEELNSYALTGPDEFFGLLMPPPNQPFTSPEEFSGGPIEGLNIRAAVAAMPPEVRPNLRWYTVRYLDKTRGLLAFDVATHGVSAEDAHSTTGPGLTWCLSAQSGDPAGLWTCQGLWHREHHKQLLVADPTSLPSVHAILEYLTTLFPEQLADTHVIAVTSADSDSEPHLEDWHIALGSLTQVTAPSDGYAQAIAEHLAEEDQPLQSYSDVDYVWVAGEGDFCKVVRSHAIKKWQLNKDNILWCPYWFVGKARP
ncbi:siderophore-interacting protein [Corynebacterium dentalis]|uniref:siderophore-interacting protein n=1 Tax=Corynebacterium dentalis TaxID=2014528 RepID=UPI00289B5891|nr:siderophore-interacting protein [Corynebacterium dentalis]